MSNKIVIVGAGLTGLYLGYLLKMANIDFEIYEKSLRPGGKLKTINLFNTNLECGIDHIESQHYNMIHLLNKLKIKSSVQMAKRQFINDVNHDLFKYLLKKVFKLYNMSEYVSNPPMHLSAYIYIQTVLSKSEFEIFQKNMTNIKLLEMNMKDFADQIIDELYKSATDEFNYIKIDQMQLITDILANLVQEKLNLGSFVQEITHMPLTGTYLLLINNNYVPVDKLVLATNISIRKIKLNIPRQILHNINQIKSYTIIKLFILFDQSIEHIIKPNTFIYSDQLLTNISSSMYNSKILTAHITNDSNDTNTKQICRLIKNSNSDHQIIQIQTILEKILNKIFNTYIPSIVSYAYCEWSNGFHIKQNPIQTNFWHKYNMILAGEWVNSTTNSLEDACIGTIDTFKIISNPLYFDKLTHKPDNVDNIEGNKYEK
jgi:hypothetical protein